MKMTLIYPRWPKLQRQTEFHLPPHGPVVFAATVPEEVDITFIDENVEDYPLTDSPDILALSVMLTSQLPRAYEISEQYRTRGIPVVMGGIAATLHSDEAAAHADALFIGEAEGRFPRVIEDLKNGRLKPVYDHFNDRPDTDLIGTARRDLLKRELYNYRGVQMVDLIHASRGCKFNCFPCCVGYLGGRQFRPRPIDKVMEEIASIPNNRLFVVDNSLAQERQWLVELFTAMAPLKKKFVCHPILDDDEILSLAADAGCWYVYQAIYDTSDTIRRRVQRLKDHGIGVEGTILLGTDDHDEDYIKRLVDFIQEIGVNMAEFTVLTPFLHSPIRQRFESEGRIFDNDWRHYTADRVVFRPKRMTPEKLQELYYYAWDTFYGDNGLQIKMGELFMNVIRKEMKDGTYRGYNAKEKRVFKKMSAS